MSEALHLPTLQPALPRSLTVRRYQRCTGSRDRAPVARQYAPTFHTRAVPSVARQYAPTLHPRAVPSATVCRPHHTRQGLRHPRWRGASEPQALHVQRLRQQHMDKTGNTQDRLDRQWPQRHSSTGRHNINNSEDQYVRLRGAQARPSQPRLPGAVNQDTLT